MNLQKWLSVANNKKALRRSPRGAEIERRARFDYDDLLELFSFQSRGSRGPVLLNITIFVGQILLFPRARGHLAVSAVHVIALAEITFLVARLENASVLHNHAHASGKLQRQQQPLHGCGENFGRPHLAAEFDEALLLIDVVSVAHFFFIAEPKMCLILRDGIAANFLSHG